VARCAHCKSVVVFGGTRCGNLRFCNSTCFEKGVYQRIAKSLPDDEIYERTWAIHRGSCPECKGPGPVDVHVSYRVLSIGLITATSWQGRARLSCRFCAAKRLIIDSVVCLLFGWWSPRGLIVTPIQLFRNTRALFSAPDRTGPSDALAPFVRADMAQSLSREFQREKSRRSS
jgi:hypothetical protein